MATHMVYKYSVYCVLGDGFPAGSLTCSLHEEFARSAHAVANAFFERRPDMRARTICVKDVQTNVSSFYKWFEPEVPAGQKTVVITCEVR